MSSSAVRDPVVTGPNRPPEPVFLDDCHQIRRRDGSIVPILLAGEMVRAFNPGWIPVAVLDRFAPYHILVLRHGDHVAPWYLDGAMERLGGSIGELPQPHRDRLSGMLSVLFADILAAGAGLGSVDLAQPLAELTLLDDAALSDMCAAFLGASPITVADHAAASTPGSLVGGTLRVAAAFAGTAREAMLDMMRGDGLRSASPFDGRPCDALLGLPMPWRLPLFLFQDGGGRVFFLLPDAFGNRKAALFLPRERLYLTSPGARPVAEVVTQLLLHLVRHHVRIARFLADPAPKAPVTVLSDYPVLHIGHVVWNDLAALGELVRSLAPEHLPHVAVANIHQGTEAFGRVDVLFPEFSDRLIRTASAWDTLIGELYDRKLFYLRYMTRHVGRDVGRRILASLAHDATLGADRDLEGRLATDGRAFVCLGLRFGNRTIPDQFAFLVDVVEHLARRLSRVVVVVDGTSARIDADPTTLYGAFGPASSEENLISELRTVFQLRRRFAGDDRVAIVSTAGRPMAAALFWIDRCAFFVAPWGAALAKYRWVCDKPGFVLSARALLDHPGGDLLIYNGPAFNETPSPMEFIAAEKVVDAPGPGGFYSNFVPDPDAVHAGIDRLIAQTGCAAPSWSVRRDAPP